MASDAIGEAAYRTGAGLRAYGNDARTPFVLGAIALTFVLYVILRGDLARYEQIFLGAATTQEAPATGH